MRFPGKKKRRRNTQGLSRAALFALEGLEDRVVLAAGLTGAYFNNINLSGAAAGTRIDKTVNFAWSAAPGVGGVGSDNFSVRWSGAVTASASGAYTFTTNSDDGVRLFVNGQKIIDNWTKHGPTLNSGVINLTAGQKTNITMEFFEASGGATAQLMWASSSMPRTVIPETALSSDAVGTTPPPASTGDGLLGIYFDNQDFTAQKFSRVDPTLNFNWGTGSPASSIGADSFSVRWTGQVLAPKTETYTFYTKSDEGMRLTVNGKVLIDKLIPQALTEYSGSIALTGGQKYSILAEYFERSSAASAALSWSSASIAKQIVPKAQLFSGAVMPPPPPQVPSVPGGISAAALSTTQIKVSWQDVSTETLYKLERSATGTSGWTQIATPAANATSYTDGNLIANTKYYYRLRANNSTGDSGYTATVNATTQAVVTPPPPPQVPAVPGGISAAATSSTQIKISWQDVGTETSYKLERSANGSTGWAQIATPAANSTSYTDGNLTASTKYFYRLRANNAVGDSGYTATVNATTQPVVTPPPPGATYQPDFQIQVRKETTFAGEGIYNTTGDNQTRSTFGEFYPSIFQFRVYNNGNSDDSFNITGPQGDANWRMQYYDSLSFGWTGGARITDAVTAGGWNTGNIAPGAFKDFRLELLPLAALGGDSREFTLTARSVHDAAKVDAVKGTISNPVRRALEWRRQNFDQGGVCLMTVQNKSNVADAVNLRATFAAGLGSTWSAQIFDDQFGGNDITAAAKSGAGWTGPVLKPWESQEFRVVFSNYSDATIPSVSLRATCAGDGGVGQTLVVNVPPVGDHPISDATSVFPIGVWVQPASSFGKWKSRGVNTLVEYQGDGATIEQWSQAARDLGMYYIRRPLSNPALDVGDTNLLAWALPDEPEITTKYPPATLQSWIDGWKAADPNRPIWANFSGGYVVQWQGNVTATGYAPYQALTDWDSSSIYPATGWGRPEPHPGLDGPGLAVDRLEKWSNGHPQFAVIESSDQELRWTQKDIAGPTPGQFRAEVWSSIIHGAKGVIYFPESFSPSFKFDNTPPEIVAEMTSVNAKIQSLAGVLLGDIDPPTRGLQVGQSSTLEGTWRIKDGKTYYVVLNLSDKAVTQNITLQGIGGATTATVNGENRSVNLSGGTFSDSFAPFEVHVYQVG